jgi:hypothetical protein
MAAMFSFAGEHPFILTISTRQDQSGSSAKDTSVVAGATLQQNHQDAAEGSSENGDEPDAFTGKTQVTTSS